MDWESGLGSWNVVDEMNSEEEEEEFIPGLSPSHAQILSLSRSADDIT